MRTTLRHYIVTADAVTGEWISEPQAAGEVLRAAWMDKQDTTTEHYDIAEIGGETCAVTVVWAAE